MRAEGFVWTDDTEFVDHVDGSEVLDTLTMPIGDFPVLVRGGHAKAVGLRIRWPRRTASPSAVRIVR